MQQLGPLALKNMDTYPAAMLFMMFVMKNGERRPGPFSAIVRTVLTYVSMPPMPEPIIVPVSGESSSVISSPESSSASLAEATAARVKLDDQLAGAVKCAREMLAECDRVQFKNAA